MSSARQFTFITVLLLIGMQIVSVSALQEQFAVSATSPAITACAYAVTTNSIIVKNTGDIESAYRVSATGSATEFTTYSDSSFSLKQGETKTLYVYHAPGNRQGTYALETTITSALGFSETTAQSIAIANCANVHVDIKNAAATINPGGIAQFSFVVKNMGSYAEMYDFGVLGLEQYATLSTPSLFLAPGEAKQVDVFVHPDYAIYGEFDLTFQTLARTSAYLAEAPLVLTITQNYDYKVTLPATINICNDKKTVIPLFVENNVPFTNQYSVEVHGPTWLTEEADIVELGPLGDGTTALIAQPEHPGIYAADVVFTSLRGDVIKAGAVEVVVDNCYDVDVNIEQPADILVDGKTRTYALTIKNEGIKQDTFEFALDAPTWISSNALKATLKAGESKTFTLTAKPNETGSFSATFIATSNETAIVTSDVLKLKVISLEDAHEAAITPGNARVLYGEDAITVAIENNGMLPTTYKLQLHGPTWLKLPVTTLTLEPGQKEVLVLQTTATDKAEQGDYEAQVIATVANEDLGFVAPFIIKLRALTLTQEITQWSIRNWIVFAVLGVLGLFALFIAVFGKRIARAYRNWKIRRQEAAKLRAELKKRKQEEKLAKKLLKQSMKQQQPPGKFWKTVGFVLLVLLGIALIGGAVLAMAGYVPFVNEFFKQQTPEQKFAPIITVDTAELEAYGNTVIVREGQVVIPVTVKNNYDDELIFSVEVDTAWITSDVRQIELEPQEEETFNLRVTPDEAEKGIYKINVAATLEKENKRFNEDITLNVRKKSFVQDVLTYIWYLVGGLVALVIAALFARKIKKSPKTEKKVKEEKIVYKPVRRVSIDIPSRK